MEIIFTKSESKVINGQRGNRNAIVKRYKSMRHAAKFAATQCNYIGALFTSLQIRDKYTMEQITVSIE